MRRINYFIETHPELFVFRTPDHVHPHDRFIERTCLRFLPYWITPNRVTLIRVCLTPVVFLLVLFEHYILGSTLFLLTAFTDVLDGSLARIRSMITEFGILFDPLADKFLVGSLILLLVFEYYPIWVGSVVLFLEILFIVSAARYRAKFKHAKMANIWGKVKMLMQVCAVFATLAGLLLATPQFFDIGFLLFGLAIGFAVMSLFQHGV